MAAIYPGMFKDPIFPIILRDIFTVLLSNRVGQLTYFISARNTWFATNGFMPGQHSCKPWMQSYPETPSYGVLLQPLHRYRQQLILPQTQNGRRLPRKMRFDSLYYTLQTNGRRQRRYQIGQQHFFKQTDPFFSFSVKPYRYNIPFNGKIYLIYSLVYYTIYIIII